MSTPPDPTFPWRRAIPSALAIDPERVALALDDRERMTWTVDGVAPTEEEYRAVVRVKVRGLRSSD